jgi:triosephosphate isomerase (TIM)
MRIPFIAGNWKMFKTVHEAVVFVKELKSDVKDVSGVEIVVAPPFTAVHAVAEAARNSNIGVAAQDVYWEREGAFTGEVSPQMVKEAGAEYVIVGHSERRRLFGETDAIVNRKAIAAFGAGLIPIVCVGETLEEREADGTETKVTQQVRRAFADVDAEHAATAVIAYEPIWAIGTGRNAEPADAGRVVEVIRAALADRYDAHVAAGVRVQYGGSVKPSNIREFMAHPEVDGALVGGASLDPEEFALIVKYR